MVLVHGWASSPDDAWFPWLAQELKHAGHEVVAPTMPDARAPDPAAWLSTLESTIGAFDSETFLVGHSLGCRALALYAQEQSPGNRAGGVVFVAGSFISAPPHNDDTTERAQVRRAWHAHTLVPENIRDAFLRIAGVYCPDDPWVSFDNAHFVAGVLNGALYVEEGKGHFRGKLDGVTELSVVLRALSAQGVDHLSW